MNNKTTMQELQEKRNWDLKKKEEHTRKRINEFLSFTEGKAYISFSGGLDSTVLLHIARSIYPNIMAVFCNTTNEDPEIIKFVKSTPNVKILYPKMKFKEVVKKHGFPFVSKKVSRSISDLRKPHKKNPNIRNLYLTGLNRKGNHVPSYKLAKKWYFLFDKDSIKFDITAICCDILKKEPIERFNKESGMFPVTGTIAEESQDRELNYVKYGCNIYDSKTPKSRPLSIWTNKDVWDYISLYDVPYCSLYDDLILDDGTVVKAETRTGCVACAMGCHLEENSRFESLKLRNPRHYRNVMKYTNNGITFKDAYKQTFNPSFKFSTKEYINSMHKKGMQDLEGCDVECRKLIIKGDKT